MGITRNYTKETFKSKEDWLNHRGLGGSSASAILGKNPYMSKLELYRAIIMPYRHPIVKPNENMAYGIKCEPLLRKMFIYDYEGIYKVHTPRNNEMYRRIDKPYMTATTDSLLQEIETKRKGVLEIKTHDIRNKKDEEQWRNHLPDHYYIQVLHYLLVLNDCQFAKVRAKLRFYDYFNAEGKKLLRTEIRDYHIERSDPQIQRDLEILEREEIKFWEENVLKKVMPTLKFKF